MKKRIAVIILLSLILFIGLSLWETMGLEAQARRTLYWGSRGDDVSLVQRRLRQWGYYDGPISGVYGQQTYNAVRFFQRRNGLAQDGVVGPQTWGALGLGGAPRAAAQQPARAAGARGVTNNNDLHMIARMVHAEARGEPYIGQVAVAAVMLNRVRSAEFPNTISGVIYQPLAFESVANGEFNLPPTEENYRAARDAMNGWDPTYGSLFFWNPGKPVSRWIWTRRILVRYGDHVFGL